MSHNEQLLSQIPQRACPFERGARVVAYARDSGGEEQERSVDQQTAVYEAYCAREGLVLAHVYCDRARPGGSTVRRDAFQEMMYALRHPEDDQKPAGVIFWKLNRLARNSVDSQYYKADMRRRGYTLYFLADDIPEAGELSTVIEAFYEWKAQQDRIDMSIDVKRGLRARVTEKDAEGNYLGLMPGNPPTGFRAEQYHLGTKRNGKPRIVQRWVPDEAMWERCKQAWKMRAAGASYGEIHAATRLYGTIHSYSTFFKNEIYRGVLVFGDLRIEDYLSAICTDEQWAAVARMRERKFSPKHGVHSRRGNGQRTNYLLTGVLECAYCGSPMVGSRRKRKGDGYYSYYICQTKHRRAQACDSKRLATTSVEGAVLDHLFANVLTVDGLRLLAHEWQIRNTESHADHEQQQKTISAQLQQANRSTARPV